MSSLPFNAPSCSVGGEVGDVLWESGISPSFGFVGDGVSSGTIIIPVSADLVVGLDEGDLVESVGDVDGSAVVGD